MKHLHFGAGSLGLGLICPLSAKAGNDVFVFNRRSEKEKNVILSQSHRYKLRRHNSTETEEVKISGFLDYNQIDDFLHYLREESEPILITTALKEYGLNDSLSEIHKILSGVSAKKYLIACENSISSDELFSMVQERFPEIAHEENNIQVVNSVVDRICNKIKIDRQQNIVLPVEDFGRWYIEGQHDDLNALFSTFLNDNYMAVTCHDIDLQKQRKKIMVNAVHQSIALLTHYNGMDNIHDYLMTNKGKENLKQLVFESLCICSNKENNKNQHDDLTRYSFSSLERFCSMEQTVSDSITRFTDDRLDEFFNDFGRKIVTPFLETNSSEREKLRVYPQIMAVCFDMIRKKNYIESPNRHAEKDMKQGIRTSFNEFNPIALTISFDGLPPIEYQEYTFDLSM